MKTKSKFIRYYTLSAIAAAGMMALLAGNARAQDQHGTLSSSDYKFVTAAAQSGQAEVALGELAATKSSNPAVKQFAQRMVQDHTKANKQLTQIATQKGATMVIETPSSEQKELNHLQGLVGIDFDKAYMDRMVRDHKKVVKEFQDKAEDAKDPDVRTFAGTTLPVVQGHLKMAEDIDTTLKGERSGM